MCVAKCLDAVRSVAMAGDSQNESLVDSDGGTKLSLALFVTSTEGNF